MDTSGYITHFVAVNEDITDKKEREEQLIVAKEKAEESDRLKSAFLANMSHEIRTPLNAIIGYSDLLEEIDLTLEERHEFIEIIQRSGKHLLSIISDIIDLSKIEAGLIELNPEPVNFNELLNHLIMAIQTRSRTKRIGSYFFE